VDAKTGMEKGFVNLSLYKWLPEELFYLYFETSVPVHVGLYQDYPNTTMATRKVLPDTNFPDSFKTIMPGGPYKFPILMKMDKTNEAEFMSIVFVAAGTQPMAINETPKDAGSGSPPEDGVARYQKAMEEINKKARKSAKARFNVAQQPMLTPMQIQTPVMNPDEVAVCAFGPEHYGFIQLKLFK